LDAAGDKERLRKFFPESLEPWVTVNRFEPEKLKDFILRIREKAAGAHALQGKGEYDAFTNMLQAAPTLSQLVSILVKEQASEISGGRRIRSEVQLAQRLVAMRLAETITLTSIAEEVGLSSYYLSRLFREETGESFNDYVTRLRMEKAKVLLQTTQMKVYEVAESVGIPSYRYFTQLFRNWTGVAPIEYKRG
jgi:two-component system response regulator YesN